MVEPVKRMSRAARREQVLDAAAPVVAAHGFAGTTTDAVASAAGVSQPYVVRMFGGKAELLEALFARVGDRITATFRGVEPGPGARQRLSEVYLELIRDEDLLRVLLHGFSAGSDAAIGARSRAVLGEVFRIYRELTGEDDAAAGAFVAHGMMINVLLAVRAQDHLDESPELAALVACTMLPPAARTDTNPAPTARR